MPERWWNGPTATGLGLVCEWDTLCQEEALVLVWIRDGRRWAASLLCLGHLKALTFPEGAAA